jgi:hypothetical protein
MTDEDFMSMAVVQGHPMVTSAKIMAALIVRLGGRVELSFSEIESMQGVLVAGKDGFVELEANTDPVHGVLAESLIE